MKRSLCSAGSLFKAKSSGVVAKIMVDDGAVKLNLFNK